MLACWSLALAQRAVSFATSGESLYVDGSELQTILFDARSYVQTLASVRVPVKLVMLLKMNVTRPLQSLMRVVIYD